MNLPECRCEVFFVDLSGRVPSVCILCEIHFRTHALGDNVSTFSVQETVNVAGNWTLFAVCPTRVRDEVTHTKTSIMRFEAGAEHERAWHDTVLVRHRSLGGAVATRVSVCIVFEMPTKLKLRWVSDGCMNEKYKYFLNHVYMLYTRCKSRFVRFIHIDAYMYSMLL